MAWCTLSRFFASGWRKRGCAGGRAVCAGWFCGRCPCDRGPGGCREGPAVADIRRRRTMFGGGGGPFTGLTVS
eukprot:gene6466-biopygen2893